MYQQNRSQYQSQLAQPSQPLNKRTPGNARQIPQTLTSAAQGTLPARTSQPTVQTPLRVAAYGNMDRVEAEAEQAFESEVANDPFRQALGVQQQQQINDLQGAQARLAQGGNSQLGYTGAQMPGRVDETLAGRMVGMGDRLENRDLGRSGILGNVRGNQFNTGSTAYAGGDLQATGYRVGRSPAEMAARKQQGEARQAALVARMNDPSTPEGQAALASREQMKANKEAYGNRLGQSPDQQAKFADYQDRRENRRVEGLANRREFNQQRAAQKEQARLAQVQAANNPLNSQLMRSIIARRPEAAAAFFAANMQNQTQMEMARMENQLGQSRLAQELGLSQAQLAQMQSKYDMENKLGMRGLDVEEGRVETMADVEREGFASQERREADRLAAANAEVEAGREGRAAAIARDRAATRIDEIKAKTAEEMVAASPQEQRFRSFANGEIPMDQMIPGERQRYEQWLTGNQGQAAPATTPPVNTVDTASKYAQEYSELVSLIVGAPSNQVTAGQLADAVFSRHGTAQAVSDGDLASLQTWARSMDKLDPEFKDTPSGKFETELMNLLLGDRPLTNADVEAIKQKKKAESQRNTQEGLDRFTTPQLAPLRPPMGGFGAG